MNSFVRILMDLGPLIVFFTSYRLWHDMLVATAIFMICTAISLGVVWWRERRLPVMMGVTAAIITVFGSLTLWFGDSHFIRMKPTIVNTIFALILLAGLGRGQFYLKTLIGELIPLTREGWKKMTLHWIVFFLVMAIANEIIWRTQSENFWLNIKVFGYLPLTLGFMMIEVLLMQRYFMEEKKNEQ